MYDEATKNQSFLKVSKILEESGVKNNKFMLELKNENLYFVDPHDPNLSFQGKMNVLKECYDNIWYFLREVVRMPVQDGGSVPFELDISNCAQIYLSMLNCNSWITKPRQRFGTMSSLVLGDYFRIFYAKNNLDFAKERTFVYLCDTFSTDIRQLKGKANTIIAFLPYYMQNIGCVECCKHLKFSTNDQDKIDCGFVYFEEGEHVPGVKSMYEELKDKLKVDKPVQESNIVSCFTTASTISDTSDMGTFLDNSIKWFDWFYDLDPKTLMDLVNNSPTGIVHVYTTYTDLGLGEEWYTYMVRMMNSNWEAIRREVLLKRKGEV